MPKTSRRRWLAMIALVAAALAVIASWPAPLPTSAALPPAASPVVASTSAAATTAPVVREAVRQSRLASTAEPRVYPADRGHGHVFGRVLDPRGAPVAGASVALHPWLGHLPPGMEIADDRTETHTAAAGALGTFRVDGVRSGPWLLHASSGELEASAIVTIAAGRDEGPITLRLPAAPALHGETRIEVIDAAGDAVALAEVAAVLVGEAGESIGDASTEASLGRTDEHGLLVLRGRPWRSGVLFAATADGRVGTQPWRQGPGAIRIPVAAAGSVRGRLVGLPAAALHGARVHAHALASLHTYSEAVGRTFTAALEGDAFAFPALPAGTYGVTLSSATGARLLVDRCPAG